MIGIIDTSVFISGIFFKGNFCSQIIEKLKDAEFKLVSSVDIVDELGNTLRNFKIHIPENIIEELRKLIVKNSIIVEPTVKLNLVKDNKKYDMFLEAGFTGNVDLIITQDKNLLKLKKYGGIKIVSPKEALILI